MSERRRHWLTWTRSRSSTQAKTPKADVGAVVQASSSVSEFKNEEDLTVRGWEQREVTSRDMRSKLKTRIFFASIDQTSQQAGGDSACTTLVAVIADWLHNNHNLTPTKPQFDSLITEGSFQWRSLCENRTYMARFPNKHFDLETILQAKIRPLRVVPRKSFIGFFRPQGMESDFLHGVMSFDDVWDKISRPRTNDCQIYIVSWNDHFFVLKVDREAYYIVDTLGWRLHEGCNRAHIVRFDKSTVIYELPAGKGLRAEEKIVCQGKESCKEYIKSFLAAIPIRELQADMKRGFRDFMTLHQRLQIEFHYTRLKKSQK